jgi:hypothetical protein
MAVVTSPTLPFETVERHEISRALESATSLQNPILSSNVEAIDHSRYLVVSPYDELPHLLDLEALDTANQLLSRALVEMKCLREDYATAPYIETFNVGYRNLLSCFNSVQKHLTDICSGQKL